MSQHYMKEPCQHCPFRSDKRPFLTTYMGETLAYLAQNHYNTFPCHKTTEPIETGDTTIMTTTPKSLECAGFLTLVAQESSRIPQGFNPSYDIVFESSSAMIEYYNDEEMWPEE